jgi:hypothetical protein
LITPILRADFHLTSIWMQQVSHSVFGDNPTGMITYTPDGRMSVFIIDQKRQPPAGPKATDAEADELYRTMIAYSGAYSIEG